jgi:PAS domain S-box-containing protein
MLNEKINILYVDDEPNNLVSFNANFRKFFNIYTASSAEEGKDILNTREINVLITDQRMPGITGVQFLESIIKDHPFPVRILLTGYSDIETVIEAINKGQVFRYVLKPFDFEELKLIIENAYDLYLFRKSSKEALSKYHHLFEHSNDTIFIMDDGGEFMEMNSTGLNLFKIKSEDINGVDLHSLFVNSGDYRKVYAQLVRSESVIDLPIKLKNANNEIIDALFSASKIKEKGKIVGFRGMIRDITKQKEIENLVIRTIIETQETERIRFGKNLHDGVGSMLAAMKVMIHSLAFKDEKLKTDPQVLKILDTMNSTIVEMRNVCFNIMPASLDLLGLTASIHDLCSQFEDSNDLKISFNVPENFPVLNENLELAIFRIVQEFLNNAITHGKATRIEFNFDHQDREIKMTLKDNGVGFNIKSFPMGLGIKNIRSRVQSYNGDIKINSTPGMGTTFEIKLPLIKRAPKKVLA